MSDEGMNERTYFVLVVEDDEDLGDAVESILEDEGFDVVRARNGREALEQLRGERTFCAILLDVRMPVMDGLEFRRRQLLDPEIADVPLAAFCADPRERAEISRLGVEDVLSKPVRLEELIEVIDRLCSDRHEKHADRLAM